MAKYPHSNDTLSVIIFPRISFHHSANVMVCYVKTGSLDTADSRVFICSAIMVYEPLYHGLQNDKCMHNFLGVFISYLSFFFLYSTLATRLDVSLPSYI